MYELYQNKAGSRGSLAEVWIDKTAGIARKLYKVDGVTIRGTPPLHNTLSEISSLYHNELYWSNRLASDQVLKIYDHGELSDEPGYYILQEYVGPDLLQYYANGKLAEDIPDPVGQLLEMFAFFKQNDVHKLNNAMSNLVNDKGRIRAFDFKYAVTRSVSSRIHEMNSINKWLSKIDSRLPALLSDLV